MCTGLWAPEPAPVPAPAGALGIFRVGVGSHADGIPKDAFRVMKNGDVIAKARDGTEINVADLAAKVAELEARLNRANLM